VAEVVIAELEPIRDRTKQLMDDPAELVSLLNAGAKKANDVSSNTLKEVYAALGLI